MPEEAGNARAVPIGGGAALACLVCSGRTFWRRYPKQVDRIDQLLLLTEDPNTEDIRGLREQQRWLGFAEVCSTCGFVHWFSSEATKRRSPTG